MTFTKVQKSKAYFSRYQVKLRRRREGRTDYRQRKKLCIQAKNKYQSPKYRLVVRFTNKYVICQIAYSLIDGDRILAAANSAELERYGLEVGLKNYAAAYCTGLLVARRLLQKVGLDDVYEGNTEVDGEVVKTEVGKKTYYVDEVDDEKRPFRALLDVGCRATTTGCRIFGALRELLMVDLISHTLRSVSQDMTVMLRSTTQICTVSVSSEDTLESTWSTLRRKITRSTRSNLLPTSRLE